MRPCAPGVGVDADDLQCVTPASFSPSTRKRVLRRRGEADDSMAALDEVCHGDGGDLLLVRCDRVGDVARVDCVDEHHGNVGRHRGLSHDRVEHPGVEDAVDSKVEKSLDLHGLDVRIAPGIHDHGDGISLGCGLMGADDHIAYEGGRRDDIADKADDARTSATQSAGPAIGSVVQLCCRLQHPLPGRCLHRSDAAQGMRDRCRGDTGECRDISNADAPLARASVGCRHETSEDQGA